MIKWLVEYPKNLFTDVYADDFVNEFGDVTFFAIDDLGRKRKVITYARGQWLTIGPDETL